ncbi:hypothetical protein [Streptosporangium sp. NBC_01756]|uniref:hypothetical protein n=1 Tax=Streptosporangium sp. NBC_01756 TaxID=2975950 RepID=UPI002DDBA921|nr:hypothetical protein [Streptosporangium sp. NBC_01756]WSC90114.1 hypothetical protein OIE48_18605 [Streptosporangium sp. NBC_01756]
MRSPSESRALVANPTPRPSGTAAPLSPTPAPSGTAPDAKSTPASSTPNATGATESSAADGRSTPQPSLNPRTVATAEARMRVTVPPSVESSAEAAAPQLSIKQMYGIHSGYQRGLSKAQAALDQVAMGKLEHGLALEMSRASFKTARLEGTEVPSGMWPNPKVWAPRHVDGTPDWFVAICYEPGIARIYDLMSSTPAGWRLVASAADTRATPARLPQIATDADGYATSLPEDAPGLLATPRQVAAAHLASMADAEPDPMFADGPWTSDVVRFWQQERTQLEEAGWTLRLSYRQEGPVRALRTGDGGALVWYAARSVDTRKAHRVGAKVSLKGSAAVRTAKKAFTHSANATYGRMYVAHVPPAGSTEPVHVLGEWSDVLEGHGD